VDRLRSFFERTPQPDGLTISGGEPFEQPEALWEILRSVKALGVEDILIYSGYRAEELLARHSQIFEGSRLVAALVDGAFESGNSTEAVWKGSRNQTLTLWKEEFASRYEAWTRGTARKLQRAEEGGSRFIVGIPRQVDVPRLKDLYRIEIEGLKLEE
jgi:anaerobic ribonucleoside-triphosphate reductase activating protein